jgi:hypothetical protein
MAITKTARNMIQLGAGGTYSTSRDAIRHQIWDTRGFTATPGDATFFTQPVGAPGIGGVGTKTKTETNLLDSGKLPNGQTFLVTRMGVAFISEYDVGATVTSAATGLGNAALLAQSYVNVMQNSVFEIRVAGREFDFQVHGRQFLPSLVINGYLSGTAGTVVRSGDTIVSGWIKLDPSPIFLDELVSFNVTQLVNNSDTTNILASSKVLNNSFTWMYTWYSRMQVCLEGFLTRAK